MENASKALLMAASVLIGVVILSLAVYLFTSFSGSVNEMEGQIEEGQLEQFNNKFTSYAGKDNLTIYDVITVANLAIENNKNYDLTSTSNSNFYITVKLENTELTNSTPEELATKYLKSPEMLEQTDSITGEKSKKLKNYNCKTYLNSQTGRVYRVEFN